VVVEAPALDLVVIEEGAGLVAARGDGRGGAVAAQGNGGEGVAHLAGVVAAMVDVADAEGAHSVVAPALHSAVVEEGAGVGAAGGDGGGGAAGAEGDRGEGVAHLAGTVSAIGGVADPELADVVLAPALHSAVVEERAGVRSAGSDGGRGPAAAEGNDGEGVAHLARSIATGGGVADPEPPEAILAPALDLAVVEEGAGVGIAGTDGDGGTSGAEVDRGQRLRQFAACVAAVLRVAEPQLSQQVSAPALHRTVEAECARVTTARSDRPEGLRRVRGLVPVGLRSGCPGHEHEQGCHHRQDQKSPHSGRMSGRRAAVCHPGDTTGGANRCSIRSDHGVEEPSGHLVGARRSTLGPVGHAPPAALPARRRRR
jgi:hypothetical protein